MEGEGRNAEGVRDHEAGGGTGEGDGEGMIMAPVRGHGDSEGRYGHR